MGEPGDAPVLEARGVVRRYPRRGLTIGDGPGSIVAVDGVSLALGDGEVLGVIGRSGAGKSTLGRILAGLERPDEGEVLFVGERLSALRGETYRRARRRVQIVFQDPAAALNPRHSIERIVAEPIVVNGLVRGREARGERVAALLAAVGLQATSELLGRRPGELSGGERQRVAIARALACEPRVLVLDEPVSLLDVSVQGRLLNLLLELRACFSLAMVLITHDLAVAARVAERVVVMHAGRTVEEGPVAEVMRAPRSRYTLELLEAASLAG
jgi:ABC-type glutathione transport system ATPase component